MNGRAARDIFVAPAWQPRTSTARSEAVRFGRPDGHGDEGRGPREETILGAGA